MTVENLNFLMETSVWNVWNFMRKVSPQQIGFSVLYASGGYMRHAHYIHKCAEFAEEWKREK
jgi:hypothetical protein